MSISTASQTRSVRALPSARHRSFKASKVSLGTSPETTNQSVLLPLGAGPTLGEASNVLSTIALVSPDGLSNRPTDISYTLDGYLSIEAIRLADTPGLRLKVFRETLGYSQTALGDLLDVRQGTVSDWETGKNPTSRPHMRLAADLAKDSLRVFRWLERGGRAPVIVPISSAEPSEIERLYSRAVLEAGAAGGREGLVPLPIVTGWLSRLRDAAIGTDEVTPSDEGEGVPGQGGNLGTG